MITSIVQQAICTKCKLPKPLTEFYKRKGRPIGRTSHCKTCIDEDSAIRNYSPEGRERDKGYRQKPEYKKSRNESARRKYSPMKELSRTLRKRYNLTVEDFNAMIVAQNGRCAICLKPPGSSGRLFIDHDHQSGIVRGLLCGACNNVLGRWQDSPETAQRAVDYLLKHRQLKLVV